MEHIGCEVILDEELRIPLDGRMRQARLHRIDVEGILPRRVGEVPLHRLVDGEVEELLEEEHPGHPVELLGRAAQAGVEVLGQLACRHQVEHLGTEKPRPVAPQHLERHGGEHRAGGVEEPLLSGVNGVPHSVSILNADNRLGRSAFYHALAADARANQP